MSRGTAGGWSLSLFRQGEFAGCGECVVGGFDGDVELALFDLDGDDVVRVPGDSAKTFP